jgi:hypothetical protein
LGASVKGEFGGAEGLYIKGVFEMLIKINLKLIIW